MKVFVVVLFLIVLMRATDGDTIQMSFPDGELRGSVLQDFDGGKFFSFTRIPFAKPPVGAYRFRRSVPNKPWQGVLDATQPTPSCIQPSPNNSVMLGQEDCLYLNVYTKDTTNYALKPVLVYIHGGKFLQGSSADYGPEFMMTEDIILVTINYRLGVYGFINTVNIPTANVGEMFGNDGFKDQILALKWIQKNILFFGGDPRRVTISGESAGSMAVHGHVLSPLSTGLFQQAISMSGSTLVPEMQTLNDTASTIAQYLGFDTSNYNIMMESLRNASNEDLFRATGALKWFDIQLNAPCLTALVIEKPGPNSFISDYPLNIIRSGQFNQVPYMIGSNNREGLFLYASMEIQQNLRDPLTNIPFYFDNKTDALNRVQQFYNLSALDGPQNSIDFYTDIWYRYHTLRTAREHAKVQVLGNIYCYQFSGVGKLNYLKSINPIIQNMYGASHADELGYLFVTVGVPEPGSLEETLMRTLVKTWTNFVKYGRPLRSLNAFQANIPHYVNITNTAFVFGFFHEPSFRFWDNMYNSYSNGLY